MVSIDKDFNFPPPEVVSLTPLAPQEFAKRAFESAPFMLGMEDLPDVPGARESGSLKHCDCADVAHVLSTNVIVLPSSVQIQHDMHIYASATEAAQLHIQREILSPRGRALIRRGERISCSDDFKNPGPCTVQQPVPPPHFIRPEHHYTEYELDDAEIPFYLPAQASELEKTPTPGSPLRLRTMFAATFVHGAVRHVLAVWVQFRNAEIQAKLLTLLRSSVGVVLARCEAILPPIVISS